MGWYGGQWETIVNLWNFPDFPASTPSQECRLQRTKQDRLGRRNRCSQEIGAKTCSFSVLVAAPDLVEAVGRRLRARGSPPAIGRMSILRSSESQLRVGERPCLLPFTAQRETAKKRSVRRPVSRVLSRPRIGAMDGHSSGTSVAGRLARPTRAARRKRRLPRRSSCEDRPAGRPYAVLLPVGFALPPPSPAARCALTAPFHPYLPCARAKGRRYVSVALSLRSPSPGVTRHRVPVEPGLSSPRPSPAERQPSSRLTRWVR